MYSSKDSLLGMWVCLALGSFGSRVVGFGSRVCGLVSARMTHKVKRIMAFMRAQKRNALTNKERNSGMVDVFIHE